MERRFFRSSVRQLLALMAVVGVLLAIVAPRLQNGYRQRRIAVLNQQMFAAAAVRDWQGVMEAIAAGADPNACNEKGNRPLGFAVLGKNLPLVERLLQAGADPDFPFGKKPEDFPLHFAVAENNVNLARRLLHAGAEPPLEPLLHLCVNQGSDEMLDLLLSEGSHGEKPLSAQWVPEDRAPLFLRPRSEIRAATTFYHTIESPRSPEMKLRLVRVLLKHGAEKELRKHGYPAREFVAEASDQDLTKLLGILDAALATQRAVLTNDLQKVRGLVLATPEVLQVHFLSDDAIRPEQGWTLLGYALWGGHRDVAEFLIEAGAPLDVRESPDRTLMHVPAIVGHPELIKLLAVHGLDVNAQDANGDTPLHGAAVRGNEEVVAALIELGADVNFRGRFQRTPLHVAAVNNQPRVAQLLRGAGADASLVDQDGRTPAQAALRMGISYMPGNEELFGILEEQKDAAADR